MSPRKRRNFRDLIEHSNDIEENIQLSAKEEPFDTEEYEKIHDKDVLIGVAKTSIINIFKRIVKGKAPDYEGVSRDAIYQMPREEVFGEISISLLGDWGTYTENSLKLAKQVTEMGPTEKGPHYTIHLGDTYFTGSKHEIDQCYNPDYNSDAFNNWCYGERGSFAMLGNHEMYSLGSHYYETLLKRWMGNWSDGNKEKREPQKYSYFCLENEYWRIIALDTGTESHNSFFDRLKIGWKKLKGKSEAGLTSGNTELDIKHEQKKWLENEIFKEKDDRGIILLTHHQPWDILKGYVYPRPAKTLADQKLIGNRKILWLCGHDHYFSMYKCNKENDMVRAYLRCIGHAGMPVNLWNKKDKKLKTKGTDEANILGNKYLVLYDLRERENDSNNPEIHLGYNGFANITLNKNIATVNYYQHDPNDDKITSIIKEIWTSQDGDLTGKIELNSDIKGLSIEGDINDAVAP